MQLLQNESRKWVRISYCLLLLTPLRLASIQTGSGKQESKKKLLLASPPSLHLETPLSILILSLRLGLFVLSLVQIYYFIKFCSWQLLFSFKVQKYGYFRVLDTVFPLSPRRPPANPQYTVPLRTHMYMCSIETLGA